MSRVSTFDSLIRGFSGRQGVALGVLLLGVALAPGVSQKFAILNLRQSCSIDSSSYSGLNVYASKLASPPDGDLTDYSNKLSVYYTSSLKDKTVPKDIWSSYLFKREVSLWGSPGFSWIEQKTSSLFGLDPRGKDSFLSRAMDFGSRSINQEVVNHMNLGLLTGFTGWVDRFPVSMVALSSHPSLKEKCHDSIWQGAQIYQRGFFLPWHKALGVPLKTSNMAIIKPPSLPLLSDLAPWQSYIHDSLIMTLPEYIYVSFSVPDLPLSVRLPLFFVGSFLVAQGCPSPRIRRRGGFQPLCRVLFINTIALAVFVAVSLCIVEALLAFTSILDENNSRKPGYYSLRASIVSEHALRTLMQAANEYGFTDRPVEYYDQESDCKIAVLGDSFVWGSGFGLQNIDNRWTSQLQSLLPACRVFHWGIPGWGPEEQARFMSEKGRRHDVDLIVLGVVTNDFPQPSRLVHHRAAVKSLVKSFGNTPVLVALTPWSGLTAHHKSSFQLAEKLFRENGIEVESCLDEVQSVVGDAALPRHMWSTSIVQPFTIRSDQKSSFVARAKTDRNSGMAVDRHPGMPVTLEIAKCVKRFILQQSSRLDPADGISSSLLK